MNSPPPTNGRTITLLHRLPGRIRMRLDPAPRNAARLQKAIEGHEGIDLVRYTPATRTVLVRFTTGLVETEELILRVALAHSFDGDRSPVRILTEPGQTEITASALASGGLLVAAGATRLLRAASGGPTALEWAAGAATILTVLEHAWEDTKTRGYTDPEVLSLGYLATALARGQVLRPAFLTWFATYWRHLIESPREGVTVRPVPTGTGAGEYRVEVGRTPDDSARARFLTLLRGLVGPALKGGRNYSRRSLVDEMLDVSRRHGRILDGMEWMPDGIPLYFKEEVL
jgi:hypothetical protein